MQRLEVGILGATGIVGQRFVQLLEQHPWFQVTWLAASDRSAGRVYIEAARWKLAPPVPDQVGKIVVEDANPRNWRMHPPKIVFAALESSVAAELEPQYMQAGCALVSNSSALRMRSDVPLVVPEINPEHLELINSQPEFKSGGGFAVTNPNCSAVGLALALAPLERAFGIEAVLVTTMQAVSGAGYPGVPSLDILGNVVPFIQNEEEKLESECQKILGRFGDGRIASAAFRVSAACNRVSVLDGHTESVAIKLRNSASAEQMLEVWRDFRGSPQEMKLPTAPDSPIQYAEAPDRPQPRLDVDRDHGMAVTIGRLRRCPVLDWKFTLLSHNVIRGAAGAAILNGELLYRQGRFS